MRRRGKFNAKPVTIDGLRFASTAEGRRYQELKLLEAAGEIRGLRCQVRYDLPVNGVLVGWYVADYCYDEKQTHGAVSDRPQRYRACWVPVVEDCKGVRTPVYRLKAKLMRAIHGITIREVTA